MPDATKSVDEEYKLDNAFERYQEAHDAFFSVPSGEVAEAGNELREAKKCLRRSIELQCNYGAIRVVREGDLEDVEMAHYSSFNGSTLIGTSEGGEPRSVDLIIGTERIDPI